jgi:hypothetical protein
VDVPYTSEREYLASREWRKYIADLEEQARRNPGHATRAAAPVKPAVAPVDPKEERKARRAKRKKREWKPAFDGAHRGY